MALALNVITIVDLARLFGSAVSADRETRSRVLAEIPPTDRARVEKVLSGVLASPEDELMLKLPLAETDMVDFEILEEAGNR